MADSTEMGGVQAGFPSTRWSLLRAATDLSSPQARDRMGHLLATYWKPVYRYIRTRWSKTNEDAKDLTQGFFALLLDAGHLARPSPEHGTFRSYLKTALNHFLIDEQRRQEALKRGGGEGRVPIDVRELEGLIPDPAGSSPEEAFDREWMNACLAEAVRRLEKALVTEGREACFKVFEIYYLAPKAGAANPHKGPEEEPTHESVAARLGLRPHDVNNHLFYARRRLKAIMTEHVSDYSGSDRDAQDELKFILGR